MNSAATVSDSIAPAVAEPEQALSFDEYNQQKHPTWWSKYGRLYTPGTLQNKIASLFTDAGGRFQREYETYLNNLNLRNERKATQSAQAYDEFMQNSVYSRAFQDLEKAGINPYLLLNNGSSPATGTGNASKPSYQVSKPGTKDSSGSSTGRDMALLLLAIARLAAAL